MNSILQYLRKTDKSKNLLNCHQKVGLWVEMYENRAPWLVGEVSGLNLASSIASEFARLTTIEMKTAVSGGKRGEYLNREYMAFTDELRKYTEIACAKGSVILKPYVKKGHIFIDCIHPEDFMPLEYDSDGKITAAAFTERIYSGDKIYTRVEEHRLSDNYIIKNSIYLSKTGSELGKRISIKEVPEWADLQEYAELSGVEKPLFAHLKMPFVNIENQDSPFGASVYSRAVELIKDADMQYTRMLWEFESGKRALFIDESALKRDILGRPVVPDKRLYRLLSTDDDTLFEDWTPIIRYEEMNQGLNRILRSIEFNVGLAYGTLSDAEQSDKTAEEIRSSKQRSYAAVADIQRSLKRAMNELLYAMDIWCSVYKLAPKEKCSLNVEFSDSIITDVSAEFNQKKELLELGIMQPWEMRAWYFGEDEERAKSMILKKR